MSPSQPMLPNRPHTTTNVPSRTRGKIQQAENGDTMGKNDFEHLLAELRETLARQSIQKGQFTLASGASSNYYCDTKATTMSPHGAKLTGEVLFELLKDQRVEAVG